MRRSSAMPRSVLTRVPILLTLLAGYVGLTSSSTSAVPAPAERPDLAMQLAHVNDQLARYHGTDSVKSDRKLRFVYFAPSDRPPAINYRERLTRVMEETADFFAHEFRRVGLVQVQPLAFDREADGLLRIIVVRGREPWHAYNSKEDAAARKVREECLPALRAAGIDPSTETILLFHTIMEWDEAKRRFREDAPYRGMGDARSGFCWQIDAPPLDPRNISAREPMIDDGQQGRIGLGHWSGRYIGGVIHELGHAFGLRHNRESAAEAKTLGHSLMGEGNNSYGCERHGHGLGTFLSTADALRLASHPLFTGSVKGLDSKAYDRGGFCDLRLEAGRGTLIITGRIESSPSSYGVIAYLDPEGNGDYDTFTAVAVPDEQGRFRIEQRELPRGKLTQLRLAGLQVNGLAITYDSLPAFLISANGEADLREVTSLLLLGR
jgi:hypothetical protein